MKISILGAGSWGLALAQVLNDNNNDVLIYARREEVVTEINSQHTNKKYFPSVIFSEKIKATFNLKEAVQFADILLIAVPVKAYRSLLLEVKDYLNERKYFISTAKGFEEKTLMRMSDVIRDVIPESYRYEIISLLGPSHAEEVVLRELTCIASVSRDNNAAKFVQKLFSYNYFRVYTQNDEIGAESASALKNAIAIASGILQGIALGDNARAALVTRGLKELIRFGLASGGKFETFMGLTGVGDLLVTCNSWHSRNFQAGYAIGKADLAKEFLEKNDKTVEGIQTVKLVHQIAKEKNISMPIIDALYDVLFRGLSSHGTVYNLMLRELKPE